MAQMLRSRLGATRQGEGAPQKAQKWLLYFVPWCDVHSSGSLDHADVLCCFVTRHSRLTIAAEERVCCAAKQTRVLASGEFSVVLQGLSGV